MLRIRPLVQAASILCLSALAGCGFLHQYLGYPAADVTVPDPRYAYLIVDSRVVPEREGQLTSIHIRKFGGGVQELAAGTPAYAVIPERYEVTRVHFTHPAQADVETRFLQRRMRFKTKPGVVYYLGMFELADQEGSYSIRLVRDEDLYRRACAYAPTVFEIFPLQYVLDEHADAPFGPCGSRDASDQPAVRTDRDSAR